MAGDVTTTRGDYDAARKLWDIVDDATSGEWAVKAKGDFYLPRPNPTDRSAQNIARFDQYLFRAVYVNAAGRTVSGLVGVAFSQWPEIEMPAALDFLKDDASGSGTTLIQQAQIAVAGNLKRGRGGLLVDFPVADRNVSKADQATQRVHATITNYEAKSIINWRPVKRGGRTMLGLVVLAETYDVEDEFATKTEPQYRVLRLDQSYTMEVWRKTEAGEWVATITTPLDGAGKPWTEIPFTFYGAQNNEPEIGPVPMYDLCVINLAHYRNSADYEDSVYACGQPQVWLAGLDEAWRDHLEAQGIYVGSRSVGMLPVGGSAQMLQASPNTLAKEAMDQKEAQLAAHGARLVQPGSAVKTATQTDSEDATAHSVLSLVCDNVSAAYTKALGWVQAFEGVTGTVSFAIPTKFVTDKLDAQTLTALFAGVQQGLIPESDFWAKAREAGFIDADKTDEEIREEIAQQNPGGGAADALDDSEVA